MDKHNFTFSNLRPGQGSNEQPYLRLLMFITKRPDISDEKFHQWWKSVHADLALTAPGWNVHVSRYVQLHQTAEHKAALKAAGMEPLGYDGVGEMYVKSLDDYLKFASTPFFTEKMVHDGPNFMDGNIRVMAGYDNLIYGSKIKECGSNDGVLPSDARLRSKL